MDQIKEEMSCTAYIERFTKDFEKFAAHKVEHWYLNTLKNYCSDKETQMPGSLVSISDFAQNIKISKKNYISEEYFHKAQIAMYGSVSSFKSNS